VSCALRGGEEILEHLCHKAGVQPGQTTADGKLTLEFAECLGACEFAPCMLANQTLHKDLTPEKADAFLEQCRGTNGQP
jgi:NADH-quinone oxidoreductase subunit E